MKRPHRSLLKSFALSSSLLLAFLTLSFFSPTSEGGSLLVSATPSSFYVDDTPATLYLNLTIEASLRPGTSLDLTVDPEIENWTTYASPEEVTLTFREPEATVMVVVIVPENVSDGDYELRVYINGTWYSASGVSSTTSGVVIVPISVASEQVTATNPLSEEYRDHGGVLSYGVASFTIIVVIASTLYMARKNRNNGKTGQGAGR